MFPDDPHLTNISPEPPIIPQIMEESQSDQPPTANSGRIAPPPFSHSIGQQPFSNFGHRNVQKVGIATNGFLATKIAVVAGVIYLLIKILFVLNVMSYFAPKR